MMKVSSTSSATPKMLPIIGASTIGTIIEWYDFSLYGFLAATVFAKLFFPSLDPLTGTMAAFATYYAGFIARPLGGAFFGWFGDRVGRKSTLVATLLLMGVATIAVGLAPTTAQIGVAAPLLITALRFLQGFGVGGEWAGSVLLPFEYSKSDRRGFWASWPQIGAALGGAFAVIAVLVFQRAFPGQAFYTIGWRIPFLLSIVLILVGLIIRFRIHDTPIFTHLKQERQLTRSPLLSVIKQSWREIIFTALARAGEQIPVYLFSTFILSYGVITLKLGNNLLFAGILAATLLNCFVTPTASYLSDRVGRRRWYLAGLVLMAAFSFPFFLLLQTRIPLLVILTLAFAGGICVPWLYGPQAALISERFEAKHRYSGSSLGYQIGGLITGGPAPLVATFLIATYHSSVAVSLYIIVAVAVSFLATWQLRDNKRAVEDGNSIEASEERTASVASLPL